MINRAAAGRVGTEGSEHKRTRVMHLRPPPSQPSAASAARLCTACGCVIAAPAAAAAPCGLAALLCLAVSAAPDHCARSACGCVITAPAHPVPASAIRSDLSSIRDYRTEDMAPTHVVAGAAGNATDGQVATPAVMDPVLATDGNSSHHFTKTEDDDHIGIVSIDNCLSTSEPPRRGRREHPSRHRKSKRRKLESSEKWGGRKQEPTKRK